MTEVEIGEDYILLKDSFGEIVKWIQPEWEEEPEVVPTIANAVKLALLGKEVRDFLQEWVPEDKEAAILKEALDEGYDLTTGLIGVKTDLMAMGCIPPLEEVHKAFITIADFDVDMLSYKGQTLWNFLAKEAEKENEI